MAAPEQPTQALPYWMSDMIYTTTSDGVVIVTDTTVRFPLTYYGPSIPLGPDWVYGGFTPVPSIGMPPANPTEAPSQTVVPPVTTEAPPPATTPVPPASPTLTSAPGPTASSVPGPTATPTVSGTTAAPTTQPTSNTIDTSVPSTSLTPTSVTPTSITGTASTTSTSSTPTTGSPTSTLPTSASESTTKTGTSSSGQPTGGTGGSSNRGLGPDAILGIVVGIIAFLFLGLFILLCCLRWRRRTPSPEYGPGAGVGPGSRLRRTPRHMDYVVTRDQEHGGPDVMGGVGASPMRQRTGGGLFGSRHTRQRSDASDTALLHDEARYYPNLNYHDDPSRGVYGTIYEDDEEDEEDDYRPHSGGFGSGAAAAVPVAGNDEQRRSVTSSGGSRTRPSAGGAGTSINTNMFVEQALFFNPDDPSATVARNPTASTGERPNLPSPSNSTSDIHDYGTLLASDDPGALNFNNGHARMFNAQHTSLDAHSSVIDPGGPNYPRVSPYERVPYPDSPSSDSDEHTRLLNLLSISPPLAPHVPIPSSAGIPSPSDTAALMAPLGAIAMARRSSSEPLPGTSTSPPPPVPMHSASQPNPAADPIPRSEASTPPVLTLRDFLDRELSRHGSPHLESPLGESPMQDSPVAGPSSFRRFSNEPRSPDSTDSKKDRRGLKGGSTRTSVSSKKGGTSPSSLFGSLFSGWRGGGSGEGGAGATTGTSSSHGHGQPQGSSGTPPTRWPSGGFGHQQKPGVASSWAPIAGASWAPSAWKPVPNKAQFTPPRQYPEPTRTGSWNSLRDQAAADAQGTREVGVGPELTASDTGNHRLTGYSSASTARGDLAAWQQVLRGSYAQPSDENPALRASIYSTNPAAAGGLVGFGTIGTISSMVGDRNSALGLGDMLPAPPAAMQTTSSMNSLRPPPPRPSRSALRTQTMASADRPDSHISMGSASGKSVYHDATSAVIPGSSRGASREDDIFAIDEELPPMPVPYALPPLPSTSAAGAYGLTPVQQPSSSTTFAPQPPTQVGMADLITPPVTPPRNFPTSYSSMSPFGTPTKTALIPYPTLVATPFKRVGATPRPEGSTMSYPQAQGPAPGAWLRSGHESRPSQDRGLDALLDMPPPPGAAWNPDASATSRRSADDVFRDAAERQQIAGQGKDALYLPPGLDIWNRRRSEGDQPPETEQDIGEMGRGRAEDLEAAPPSARPEWKGIRVVFPTPDPSQLRPNTGSSLTPEEQEARRLTFGQSTYFEPGPAQYLDLPDLPEHRPLSPQTANSQQSSAGSRQSMFSTYSSHPIPNPNPNPSHRAPSLTAFGIPPSPARAAAARLAGVVPVPPLPSTSRLYPPPLPLPPSRGVHRRIESLTSAGDMTLSPSSSEEHSRTLSVGETNWTRPTSLESAAGPVSPLGSAGHRATWGATDFSLVSHPWSPPGILEDLRHTAVAAELPSPLTFADSVAAAQARAVAEERAARYATMRTKASEGVDEEGRPLRSSAETTGGKEWDDVMRLLQG